MFFDFAGQGPFMSDAKNPSAPFPGIPWSYVLFGHAVIHGAFVALVTGYASLGVMETFVHFFTDLGKCRKYFSFMADQSIHLGCKLLWWMLVMLTTVEIRITG